MRKLIILLSLLSFVSLFITGCSAGETEANVKDIIVENVSTTIDINENGYYIKIIRTLDELKSVLPQMGFSSDTLEVYDSEFFNEKVLLAIVIKTGASNDVLLDEINLAGKSAMVKLDIKTPNYVDDLLSNKGIVIEVERAEFSKVLDVEIDLNGN